MVAKTMNILNTNNYSGDFMKKENRVIVVSEQYMEPYIDREIRDSYVYATQFCDLHWYSDSLTTHAWHMCNFMRRDKGDAWYQLAVIHDCNPRALGWLKRRYTGASIIAVDETNYDAICELGRDISEFYDRQDSIEHRTNDIDSIYCELVRNRSCTPGNNKLTNLLDQIKNITEHESVKNIESRINRLMTTI
jgi:hypothetical protein